jgi:ribA/ribD-fused uncharacterized protein
MSSRAIREPYPDLWFTKRENGKTVHNWPSNFFIEPDGTHVEREYQAAKHLAHPWRVVTLMQCSPGEAKKLGRSWKLSPGELRVWNDSKRVVMKALVSAKLNDHPEIGMALIASGDTNLVEQNWWHDNYWGNCTCLRCFRNGDNELGKIWMELRSRLAAG